MLTLTVEVPRERDRTAVATLRDGLTTIASGHAAASAMPSVAARHSNPACDPLRPWGHPPLGTYRILNREPASPELVSEYGTHLLLFEPESGAALDAEAFGRLALLVYGGGSAKGDDLRRTQGGLRLSDAMLAAIVERLGDRGDMQLELVALRQPSRWQFWKSAAQTYPLADSRSDPPAAPLDEMSVLEALLRKSVRRPRGIDRDDTAFDTGERGDRSSSGSQPERFQGAGGAGGGAGASGSWAAGERGVDSAGRIVAGAAVAGGIAAIAAGAAAAAGARRDAESDAAGDAGTVDTTTNTAY